MSTYRSLLSTTSASDVHDVAKRAIKIFGDHNLDCLLVGGVACNLYGNRRSPGDVDLVVQTDLYTQERLKALLVTANPDFYLVAAKTPGATYRVLWCRLTGYRRSCKVDILLPGIMNIPRVPRELIKRVQNLPVMPLAGILLLKLQAWEDHRDAEKWYMREKAWVDKADLSCMLPIAIGTRLQVTKETWLPEDFVRAGKARAKRLVPASDEMYGQWKKVGLL